MPQFSQKQRVSITVDAQLLAEIDKLTENRSAAFEEALRLWRAKKIESQLRQFYQNRTQVNIEEEQDWAQFAQEQMEETLESEGL
jgi:metal-responsive CopG/Arc/MetJ family transcriptional regulator